MFSFLNSVVVIGELRLEDLYREVVVIIDETKGSTLREMKL